MLAMELLKSLMEELLLFTDAVATQAIDMHIYQSQRNNDCFGRFFEREMSGGIFFRIGNLTLEILFQS